jgi:RNA 3'-terminal phosphate cyclase
MSRQPRIGLAETLGQLRAELAEAQAKGADERLRFEIAEAEVEFQVAVSREATPGGKIKFEVVSVGGVELGADGKISKETTHRITLKLAVKDGETGRHAEVTDAAPRGWGD